MTSQNLTDLYSGASPRLMGRIGTAQRRARLWFYVLLFPVFVKIVWLHCRYPQDQQFRRLGQRWTRMLSPLPERWARWAAYRVGKIIEGIPVFRRRPCYWRSQVIYDLLPRFGYVMELHVGASLEGGKTTPHLWVSTQGVVLVDDVDRVKRYAELTTYTTKIQHD